MRHLPGTAYEKPAGPHAAQRRSLRKEPLSLPADPKDPTRGTLGRPDTCAGSCRWSPGRPGLTPGSPHARRPQTAALPPRNTRPGPRSGRPAGPAGAGAAPPVGGPSRQAGGEPGVLTWAAEKRLCRPGHRSPGIAARPGSCGRLLHGEETQSNACHHRPPPVQSMAPGLLLPKPAPACRGFYPFSSSICLGLQVRDAPQLEVERNLPMGSKSKEVGLEAFN